MMTGAEFPTILRPCPDPMAPPAASPSLPSEGGFQGHNFTGTGPPLCAGCSQPIMDQFILQVQGHTWHSRCLRCAACRVSLSQTCYAGNNQIYCQDDFYRLFGTHCSACKTNIPPTEVVRRAHDNVYHLNCFRCSVCARELRTGDEFYLGMEGHLLCQADFATVKHEEQDENENPDRPSVQMADNHQKTQVLTEHYSQNANPKRPEMEEMATRLGMELTEVRIWFKQRRAKTRRKGDDSSNSSFRHPMKNRVTPPSGGYPLPIVNKARSPGRLPTTASHPIQVIPPIIPGRHPPFQQTHHAFAPGDNFRAWEELWSNDFVPPNVDLEPNHLENGEVVRMDRDRSAALSVPPTPTPGQNHTGHAPLPIPPAPLPLPPSSTSQHHQQLQQHQHPCNMSSNNEHGIGNVPWVS